MSLHGVCVQHADSRCESGCDVKLTWCLRSSNVKACQLKQVVDPQQADVNVEPTIGRQEGAKPNNEQCCDCEEYQL